MTKLLYKEAPLTNSVIPNLQDGFTYLGNGIQGMSSLSVPGSFPLKWKLNEIESTLSDCKKELIEEKEHLNTSIFKLDTELDSLEKRASILPITEISNRNMKF